MKKELRKKFKRLRSELLLKEEKSLKICNNFLNSDTYKNAKIILCYAALKDEVNTDLIIKKSLEDGKVIALPRCIDKNGLMIYYIINSLDDLEMGSFGISEPNTDCAELKDFADSVCIVPALSFDKYGYRLGYGKGFYDRFLENYIGCSVGLCYNELLSLNLPINEFDRSVNIVITDCDKFFCKGE